MKGLPRHCEKCPRDVTLKIKIPNDSENNVAKFSENKIAKISATYQPFLRTLTWRL